MTIPSIPIIAWVRVIRILKLKVESTKWHSWLVLMMFIRLSIGMLKPSSSHFVERLLPLVLDG